MSNRRTRVEIVIRQRDETTETGYATEWGHQHQIAIDEWGVMVEFGARNKIFVPWTSVIRIDYSNCACAECAASADTEEQPA